MHVRRSNRRGIEVILASLLLVVIVVAMSVVVYAWSLGIFGSTLPAPVNGKEILVLENQGFSGANNVTLYLRNTGTAITTLVSYYVGDLNGNQCAKRSGWSQGPYFPTQLAIVPLSIQSSSSCSWTGTPFTFEAGNTYTIVVVSQRNQQFLFTIQS